MTPEQARQRLEDWKRDRDAEMMRAFPGDPEMRHFLISYPHAPRFSGNDADDAFRDELHQGLHGHHENRLPPTERELDERGVPLNAKIIY